MMMPPMGHRSLTPSTMLPEVKAWVRMKLAEVKAWVRMNWLSSWGYSLQRASFSACALG